MVILNLFRDFYNLFRDFTKSLKTLFLRNPFFYLLILLQIHKRRVKDIYILGSPILKALEARFPYEAISYRTQLNDISFPFSIPVLWLTAFPSNLLPKFSPLMPERWREMDRALALAYSDRDNRFPEIPEMCTDECELLYILLAAERELTLLDFYIPLTTTALALSIFLFSA